MTRGSQSVLNFLHLETALSDATVCAGWRLFGGVVSVSAVMEDNRRFRMSWRYHWLVITPPRLPSGADACPTRSAPRSPREMFFPVREWTS